MSFKKKKHNWWGVIIFQESHLTQTYHEGLLKLQSKEYDKAQELLESVLKDPLIANAQVFPFLFVELLCATVFVLWLIQVLYSLTMVLVIQAADGKSSDGHLLQLRLTHNVHTFASFFCLSYNSHYLCFHWVNYSFLISGFWQSLSHCHLLDWMI